MRNLKFNLLLIITILVGLNSCVATKKQKDNFLAKYCERKDSISYVVKDSIVYKDTTVYLPTIINTPIYLENPCKLLCDSLGNLKHFDKTSGKGSGLISHVHTLGNSIIFDCKTDSLKARIQWLEKHKTITTNSHTENTVQKPCELEHRTKFDGFTWWWFWITVSISSLWVLIKLGKGYLQKYLPFLK